MQTREPVFQEGGMMFIIGLAAAAVAFLTLPLWGPFVLQTLIAVATAASLFPFTTGIILIALFVFAMLRLTR